MVTDLADNNILVVLQSAEKARDRWKRIAFVALAFVLVLAVALIVVVAMLLRSEFVYDERLLGTWQSDADRTIADLRDRRAVDETQEAGLRQLFGKLKITYSRTSMTTDMNEIVETGPYQVVATDDKSVVVRERPSVLSGEELVHIHFVDGDTYWVPIGGGAGSREFFRRVK